LYFDESFTWCWLIKNKKGMGGMVKWIYWTNSFHGYSSMMDKAINKALNNLNQFIGSYEDNMN
jgi:hypothetical protein